MIRSRPVNPLFPLRGASLMEVLVAIVVLSLGGLVAGAMQGTSQRANHDAQQRLIATFFVNEIIEKMRTNPAGLAAYDHDMPLTGGTIGAEPSPRCVADAGCTPFQLARHDLWAWEQSIAGVGVQVGGENVGGLVNPAGCISTNDGRVSVVLSWSSVEPLSDSAAGPGVTDSCGESSEFRRQVVVNTFVK